MCGAFPNLHLPAGICGCGHVLDDGRAVIAAPVRAVEHYLAQGVVKRVDIWWAWESGDDVTPAQREEKLDLPTFVARNAQRTLEPNTAYRVSDYTKFRQG